MRGSKESFKTIRHNKETNMETKHSIFISTYDLPEILPDLRARLPAPGNTVAAVIVVAVAVAVFVAVAILLVFFSLRY